ncbi:hypothetical protein FACS189419_05890 [Planctomycetales bacterium]|nr:hypothetical protein FACS189419_05890 [Planctomycetales bacterium]
MTTNEKITAAKDALLSGNITGAEKLYQEILNEEPENFCAMDGLGIVRSHQGEISAGIQYFNEALLLLRKNQPESNPQWEAALLFHIGLAYRSLGHKEEALKILAEAASFAPEEPDLLLNLGQLHFDFEHYAEAIGCFRSLTCVQPQNASAWLTLGYILFRRKQYQEAVEVLQKAETLDVQSPEICLYLAESLRNAERYKESLPYYQQLLQLGTEYPQAIHGYGKALLALGNFTDGWDAMEFRLLSTFGTWERHLLPNWTRETNREHHNVLVYSEEGIAADLMFASCLPDFVNTVERCVIECDSSLHNLFRRSFPRAEVVNLPQTEVTKQYNLWGIQLDSQIPMGSLPRFFRRDRYDFPLRKAYLVPDKEKVTRWANRLAEIGDAKKIGILWQGNWTAETPEQTSLPIQELRQFIAKHSNAAWINLQNGSAQKSLGQRNGRNPYLFSDAFQYDLDEIAALLTALDLVITPPGYIAHLAGALGVNTWLVLPTGADWRHLIDVKNDEIQTSIWHNSMTVYRQKVRQSWGDVFRTMDNDLEQFLTSHRPPEKMPTIIAFPSKEQIALRKVA